MAKRLPGDGSTSRTILPMPSRFLMGNGFTTGTILHVEGGHRLI